MSPRSKSQTKHHKRLPRACRPLTRKEKDAKKHYESYRRRRKCLGNKGFELNTRCNAQVFVLVKDKDGGRSHFWSSENLSDVWPPSGIALVADNNAREIPLKNEDAEKRQTRRHVLRTGKVPIEDILHESSDEDTAHDSDTAMSSSRFGIAESATTTSRSQQVKSFLGRFQHFSSQQAAMWRGVRMAIGGLEQ